MRLAEKNSGRPENLRFSDRMYKKGYTKRKSKLKMKQTDLSGQQENIKQSNLHHLVFSVGWRLCVAEKMLEKTMEENPKDDTKIQ